MARGYHEVPCQCGEACGRIVAASNPRQVYIHRACQGRRWMRGARTSRLVTTEGEELEVDETEDEAAIEAAYRAALAEIRARRLAS